MWAILGVLSQALFISHSTRSLPWGCCYLVTWLHFHLCAGNSSISLQARPLSELHTYTPSCLLEAPGHPSNTWTSTCPKCNSPSSPQIFSFFWIPHLWSIPIQGPGQKPGRPHDSPYLGINLDTSTALSSSSFILFLCYFWFLWSIVFQISVNVLYFMFDSSKEWIPDFC